MDHQTIQKEFACINPRHACDETLWLEFKSGDRRAFAILYLRYYKILAQAGAGICYDGDMTMDCIHDLFVEMWKNRHGLGLPHSVKAYLIRSLQRKLLRLLKKKKIRCMPATTRTHTRYWNGSVCWKEDHSRTIAARARKWYPQSNNGAYTQAATGGVPPVLCQPQLCWNSRENGNQHWFYIQPYFKSNGKYATGTGEDARENVVNL